MCSLQMPFFFRLTRVVMWHPIKINLHECGLEGAGLGLLCWRRGAGSKWEASEKASVTESSAGVRGVRSGARGRQARKQEKDTTGS